MRKKECIAMLLAGGNGTRLGTLTKHMAKPMVHYGGRYRIIDFTLSNCAHSGMDTVGVLTQYRSPELHDYIGDGRTWKLDGGMRLLPSYESGSKYSGTADAVYQNLSFIEQFEPEHVLILSGDHIYRMDYEKMLAFHKIMGADATIAAVSVPREEASRFGIIKAARDGSVAEFDEKPEKPESGLASMGIYIFKWSKLRKYLTDDHKDADSAHDFGHDVIPGILSSGEKLYAYRFRGYWRDIGTVQSLWESNMDLLSHSSGLDLSSGGDWEIFAKDSYGHPCHLSNKASIRRSIISEGCGIHGKVENSVICNCACVGEGAEIIDSILMPGALIGKNAKVHKAIIGTGVSVGENTAIGSDSGLDLFLDNETCSNDISLVGPGMRIGANIKIKKNSYINGGSLFQNRLASVTLPVVSTAAAKLKPARA